MAENLNKWKHEKSPYAIREAEERAKKITACIKKKMTINEKKFRELSSVISISLREVAAAITHHDDFSSLKEFNELMANIHIKKEDKIQMILAPQEYREYQKINWIAVVGGN